MVDDKVLADLDPGDPTDGSSVVSSQDEGALVAVVKPEDRQEKLSSKKRGAIIGFVLACIGALGGIPAFIALCNELDWCGDDPPVSQVVNDDPPVSQDVNDDPPVPQDVNVVVVDPFEELVTLRNDSTDDVKLAGWYLEDEMRHRFDAFPLDHVLEPGEHVTIHTGEGTPTDIDLYWGRKSDVWNNPDNGGDTAFLYDHDDRLVDSAPTSTSPRPSVDVSISSSVEALRTIFPQGRNRDVGVMSSDPVVMVREYVELVHGDVHTFDFVEDSRRFASDERIAGTMPAETVEERVRRNIEELRRLEEDERNRPVEPSPDVDRSVSRLQETAVGLLDTLAASGAAFGFDGFAQSSCAAPTEMLLVLDEADQMVYSVDLWPCLP